MGGRRVRPGLHRPGGQSEGSAGFASLVAVSALAGLVTGLAAAGGIGPFAVLRPPHPAAEVRRVALNASQLFPPPSPATVYRQVDVYDPAPPASLAQRPAAPAAPAPAPVAAAPPPSPVPAPSPTDDGGGSDP